MRILPHVYYAQYLEKFKGARINKARELNRLKLVKETDDELTWEILPIDGYNKTKYRVGYDLVHHTYFCNGKMCVKNNKKGMICAHVIAVNLFLRIKYDQMSEGFDRSNFWPNLETMQRYNW